MNQYRNKKNRIFVHEHLHRFISACGSGSQPE